MHPMEHICTMLMLKICKHTFYACLSQIWKFYPESFCDKNHAIRKDFVFSDSGNTWGGYKSSAAACATFICSRCFVKAGRFTIHMMSVQFYRWSCTNSFISLRVFFKRTSFQEQNIKTYNQHLHCPFVYMHNQDDKLLQWKTFEFVFIFGFLCKS